MFFQTNMIATAIILAIFASGVNGYINNTGILERADDPCDLNQDLSTVCSSNYDLKTLRNILDHLIYASADLYSHYQQLFGCNNVDALQSVKAEMNLPVFPNSLTLPMDVKTYYTWMLWAQEAEVHMNNSQIMRNSSFDFLKLDETVNLMMQLACLMFDPCLEANVTLPPFIPYYTDPIEFRLRSCVIFEAVPEFANAALSLQLGRGRRSSFREHLKRPYKVQELNPSPLHYRKEIQATTESFRDSLIDLWTHIKVSRNRRQMNNARGVIPMIKGKMSPIRKLLVNLKFKQH